MKASAFYFRWVGVVRDWCGSCECVRSGCSSITAWLPADVFVPLLLLASWFIFVWFSWVYFSVGFPWLRWAVASSWPFPLENSGMCWTKYLLPSGFGGGKQSRRAWKMRDMCMPVCAYVYSGALYTQDLRQSVITKTSLMMTFERARGLLIYVCVCIYVLLLLQNFKSFLCEAALQCL